ncbi:CocE/NonD family hydrolase [Wenzhouxiangella sp. XN201]|uniref:CocE/NonD family hydrolase n=1 Tax=Wenzhouxiangella sp. XN201 TaxID=2710755 RepID=UPI0013C7F2BC|nr:CocE/NonD family hydrolase [Wenzhouxiangella sp. XN201]NEZ03111.1 CocE/NonD family hydrolase [Wenzhouxiangella sp. XN201]
MKNLLAITLCVMFSATAVAESPDDVGRADTDVDFTWGVEIPVRDDTVLNGTLYRPDGYSLDDDGPLTTIVTITPYISDRYHPDAQYFARHGFAFLIVDTRGRGNSEGSFKPLDLEDGRDGHDIVQWIAEQPWSNGKIGMRGGSYGGYNQWVTARYFPENLDTIVPIASPYHGVDFPMNDNVQYPYVIRWLTLTAGVTPQGRTFGDNAFWERKFLEYHQSGLAFEELDVLVGMPSETFDEWISRPVMDDYWAARVPSADELARLDLPILTITGYYDGDQPGAMQYYREHMRHGSEAAKEKHYLLLGPWNHSGTRMPAQSFGGIEFGDKMMFDAFALDRDWYRWTMEDGERPEFLLDRVTYFVAGANEWKSAPSLDAVADDELVLNLGADRPKHNIYQSGVLAPEPDTGSDYSEYVYDPLDTSRAERGTADDYIVDQTEVVMTHGDGLIFHTEPFDEATEISGYVRLEAFIEMDVPDTDIDATLYEIRADGSSIALAGQTLRARHRDGPREVRMMSPGKVEKLVFDRFYWFSRKIADGSRLRLFIRPANGIDNQRHYNAAKPVHEQIAADARTATVRLHHDEDHPSRLILPVVSSDG